MKKIINKKYIVTMLSIIVSISSCSDFLEEDIYSDITSENFISQDNADQLVVGIYTALRPVYKNYQMKFLGTDIFTTKSEIFSISATNDYNNLTAGAGSAIWGNNYNVIAKANTAINRYENQISFSDSKLGDKAYGIAQAKALRALAFFNLAVQYGGVVLELDEPTSVRSDYTRSSVEETYAQIISDLEAAIPDLEVTPETGRFSQRAAQHLLSEVYLTRAYMSFGSSSDFSSAATLAEQAIGTYDIRSQNYADVFSLNNQENDEVLFAIQYSDAGLASDDNNNKHSLLISSIAEYPGIARINPYGRSDFGAMPTPFFYSLFADNDSREAATIHRALFANESTSFTSDFGTDVINEGDTVIYFPKVALDATELADKLNRYYVYQPDQYIFGIPDNISGSIYQYSANGIRANFPIFRKFEDVNIDESEGGSRDTYIFRVAGTHLLAAEAHLGAGNSAQALTHINLVRERATGVANEYTTVTLDDILNERALELAGETNRWAVLKRTGKLQERIELHNPHVIDHGAFDASTHLLRPIPSTELELSKGTLLQNPNY